MHLMRNRQIFEELEPVIMEISISTWYCTKPISKLMSRGTKAGASTVVGMVETMSLYEPEIKTVHLDRPFVYAIIDTETQMPIFLGVTESVEE